MVECGQFGITAQVLTISNNRTTIAILVLIDLIYGLGGVLGNIASAVLLQAWEPYLWLAWPLFIISVVAGIGCTIWQNRQERRQEND
ncbi:MAG: hypothetical protein ACE5HA_07425 [Anaerolineae bacterium]